MLKLVMARSVAEALAKERDIEPDEVSIDPKWLEKNDDATNPVKGFSTR